MFVSSSSRYKRYHLTHIKTKSKEQDLPPPDRDPISEPAPRDHTVKCRITRNRKGIRGQLSQSKFKSKSKVQAEF